MKSLLLALAAAAAVVLFLAFPILNGQTPYSKSHLNTSIVQPSPPRQPHSETDKIESKSIFVPNDWRQYAMTLAEYRGLIDDGTTLALKTVAAYRSDLNSAFPAMLVFWIQNRKSATTHVKKVTLYAFSEMGRPTTKLMMLPPIGQDWIEFPVDGAHVMPIEINEEDAPTQMAVLIEQRSGERHVFVVLGLKEMLTSEWNLNCNPHDDPKCSRPRMIGRNEWGNRNREMFGIDKNNIEVIHFKDDGWETTSLSDVSMVHCLFHRISGAAAMEDLTVAKFITSPAGLYGERPALVHVETMKFLK